MKKGLLVTLNVNLFAKCLRCPISVSRRDFLFLSWAIRSLKMELDFSNFFLVVSKITVVKSIFRVSQTEVFWILLKMSLVWATINFEEPIRNQSSFFVSELCGVLLQIVQNGERHWYKEECRPEKGRQGKDATRSLTHVTLMPSYISMSYYCRRPETIEMNRDIGTKCVEKTLMLKVEIFCLGD